MSTPLTAPIHPQPISETSMQPAIAPFIRRGQPIPLTPGDYAARAGIEEAQAVARLSELSAAHLVRVVTKHEGFAVYELAPAPAAPVAPAPSPAPSRPDGSAALRRLARIAYATQSPLLDEAQDALRVMMTRDIPRPLRFAGRWPGPADGSEATDDTPRMGGATAREVDFGDGVTFPSITTAAAALGVNKETLRAWLAPDATAIRRNNLRRAIAAWKARTTDPRAAAAEIRGRADGTQTEAMMQRCADLANAGLSRAQIARALDRSTRSVEHYMAIARKQGLVA